MSTDLEIRKLDNTVKKAEEIREIIIRSENLTTIRTISDKVDAMKTLAKKRKVGLAGVNTFAELKILSEWKMGGILSDIELWKGGKRKTNDNGNGLHEASLEDVTTLSDLGISRNQSSNWKLINSIPKQLLEEHFKTLNDSNVEITGVEFTRLAKSLRKSQEIIEEVDTVDTVEVSEEETITILKSSFKEGLFLANTLDRSSEPKQGMKTTHDATVTSLKEFFKKYL